MGVIGSAARSISRAAAYDGLVLSGGSLPVSTRPIKPVLLAEYVSAKAKETVQLDGLGAAHLFDFAAPKNLVRGFPRA
jgi:hypothetical protein